MQGRRLEKNDDGEFWPVLPGDYFCMSPGIWYGRAPAGQLANLGGHTVTEHEDGTISVFPSILVSNGVTKWHGYLEHGVWREC